MMIIVMKLTEKERLNRAVDWLLNVYDEVEDPIGALAETIGDRALAQKIFDNFQALVRTDFIRWKKIFGPEYGSVTAIAWIKEQLAL